MAQLLMAGARPMTEEESRQGLPSPGAEMVEKAAAHLPSVTSEELFQGQRELLILHAGEVYRLRLTRNGKLILNK